MPAARLHLRVCVGQVCPTYRLRTKGVTVCFPMNGVNHPNQWRPAAELLMKGAVQVKPLIDHRDRLENIQQVLENYDPEWIRVVLKM